MLAAVLLGVTAWAAEAPDTAPLAKGESVLISVTGETDLSGTYRVDQDGMLTLAYAGAVRAEGLTPDALERALVARLKPDYILDPRVTVRRIREGGMLAVVTAKSLRVRGAPDESASIAGGLVKDQPVRVTATSGAWCAIVDARAADANALTGWVACRYLSLTP